MEISVVILMTVEFDYQDKSNEHATNGNFCPSGVRCGERNTTSDKIIAHFKVEDVASVFDGRNDEFILGYVQVFTFGKNASFIHLLNFAVYKVLNGKN